MLEDEGQTGASRPNDKVKGELLATFAVLKSTYELERLDLAWLAMISLETHIKRHEGTEEWIRFATKLSQMSTETLAKIDKILHDDAVEHKRFH